MLCVVALQGGKVLGIVVGLFHGNDCSERTFTLQAWPSFARNQAILNP